MPLAHLWFFECDVINCGQEFMSYRGTALAARYEARHAGWSSTDWRTENGLWFCEKHADVGALMVWEEERYNPADHETWCPRRRGSSCQCKAHTPSLHDRALGVSLDRNIVNVPLPDVIKLPPEAVEEIGEQH
jgi:hypothetical protein